MFYAATAGRELAPATENGTFSDFPKENKTLIAGEKRKLLAAISYQK
jgi:hypothetical protein